MESEIPLEFRHLVPLGSGRFAAAADKRPEVWVLEPSTGDAWKAVVLDPSGEARIVGIGIGPSTLGVLLSTGRLVEVDRESFDILSTVDHPTSPGTQMSGVYGLAGGGWVVLAQAHQGSPGTAGRSATMVLHRLQGTDAELLWEEVKWTGRPSGAGLWDMMSLTGSGDTALLSGTSPPRIIPVTRSGQFAPVTLQAVPERRLNSIDLQELEQTFNRLPSDFRRRNPLPAHYPQVVRAWRHGDGLLVLAGGPGRSVMLDWYCGETFARTVAANAKMLDAVYLGDALSTLEETEWGNQLSFYSIEQLALSCS